MVSPWTRRRKLLLIPALGLAALAVLLLAIPLWLPWVLKPLAANRGATFSRYERKGYQRFVLSNVLYTNRGITFSAKRIEAFTPGAWAWRLAFGPKAAKEVFAYGQECRLRSVPTGDRSGTNFVSSSAAKANRTLHTLAQWMPSAVVSNGTLQINRETATLPSIVWSNGSIFAEGRPPRFPESLQLYAQRDGAAGYQVQARSQPMNLEANIRATNNATGLALESAIFWFTNRFDFQAQFGPTGDLPQEAVVEGKSLHFPAEMLGLPQFRDLHGNVIAKWQQGGFVLDAKADAEPLPGATNIPPLNLQLQARGDTNSATIHTAILTSPALNAQLSRDLKVYFTGKPLRDSAHISLDADLSRQNWVPVTGQLRGEADLRPGQGKYPEGDFRLQAAELSYEWLLAKNFQVQGRVQWPELGIVTATANLDDGSEGAISGTVNFERQWLTNVSLKASGPVVKRWLPKGYDYESLTFTGRVHGPVRAVAHSGELAARKVMTPFLLPQDLHAAWTGTGKGLEALQLELAGSNSLVAISSGPAQIASNRVQLTLQKLSVSTNSQPCLELKQPAQLSAFKPDQSARWAFASTPFELTGPAGRLRVEGALQWPEVGKVHVEAGQISSALLPNFNTNKIPDLLLQELRAGVAWTNGPAHFDIALKGSSAPPSRFPEMSRVWLDLTATGGPDGIVITNLNVSTATSTLARVEGRLPISVSPAAGRQQMLGITSNAPIRLQVRTDPSSLVWDELARYSGIKLSGPRLEADLSGTWAAPNGVIKAGASALAFEGRGAKHSGPNLEGLDLQVELDQGRARLTTGRVLVQGQAVNFAAEVPLGEPFWAGLFRGKFLADLEKASGRLRVEDAEIAAFQPLLPNILAPQGDVTVDLTLLPGRDVRGQITVAYARTRPLGAAGPIRGIFVNLTVKNRLVRLERASAAIGAATVTVTGEGDLTGTEWLKGELPPFNISLHGMGVPLARQPEFVLRSDLLLGITKSNGAPPLITGAARLRDSYYLSDLRDLVPGKVASPEKRPPYFSIQEPYLADWRLAVDVSGPGFLKLRSPLLNGVVSANIRLLGTLKDPIALGDARLDSGAVRFPFASLQVQQGLVSLTSQDPYHPQLSLNAASKQFGYDIRMNVAGPIDAPIIQFTSNPPLSSEQILLMVSAGELPQGNFSLTPQQRAQTVALFLGRDLLSKLGVGDETQQRLSIRSGEQISEQGRPTYQVEYKVTDRWSITGEYDRFGDFNAGVKWRVYSK